jgi:hypothetical protein
VNPGDTVAVNVSFEPFEGVDVAAVRLVVVAIGCAGGDDPLDPPPQLATPKVKTIVATKHRPRALRQRLGTKITMRKALEMPPAPRSQLVFHGEEFARTGTRTSCACVVVMVRFVNPFPVTEVGEKTHVAPDGSPEHEKVTVPAKLFSGKTSTETGVVVSPFVTVSVMGSTEIPKSGMTNCRLNVKTGLARKLESPP